MADKWQILLVDDEQDLHDVTRLALKRKRLHDRRFNFVSAYSRKDFLTVVRGVLVSRENQRPEVADKIARQLDGRTQDVRDAIRTARLTPQLGVTRAVELLMEGRR